MKSHTIYCEIKFATLFLLGQNVIKVMFDKGVYW